MPGISGEARAGHISASVFLAEPSEGEGHASTHHKGSSNGVANRDRDQVLQQNVRPGQRRPGEDAGGQDEHVRHGVLEADGNEHGDGEPNAHHLSSEILGHGAKPHGHAHKPVAHDALHHSLSESGAALLQDGVHGHVSGAGGEHPRVACHCVDEKAAKDVANVGNAPVAEDLLHRHLLLEVADRHARRVASEQLATSLEDQEQVDGEERREDRLLVDELVRHVATNHQ
mmetsp:Transcript_39540/g.73719  ORF Transcript_39540/g.73719 Transcript_39540/m.73719 type:complete len:229 (-) Transcript_39540:426-1112(-)